MFWEVIDFWFEETEPTQWFAKNAAFDEQIRQQFAVVHQRACAGELWHWRREPHGRLAEVIVLDQFSRNLFRDSPRAFAQDGMALVMAQEAVQQRADLELNTIQRNFLYMPFMHSESLRVHDEGGRLFAQNGIENTLLFERRHREIIERFGRYPHRNAVLGRESTEAESLFLQQPGSSF
ncbi:MULTISPECIES: DUF924 family protein [unclassified Oceanobacter]|jgi:uncharacterized protein (DUF924 family)|uniref:DUF924 family protein n=1 Tax=unclassified Oceanobacter TaxID=2620260 RepID=UPI0026E3B6BE|nr:MULTISPECIES: DUF924 family protein [unclassified Oceanobacter]MDO6682646.1 DUF924 family protein [Oceanobacter sp. 5_MG-2023]MDP2506864.1 DUF924 family protein [Oceanobacter sp. 3_MG-2023]MDP2547827.1 DUF924 family protein [Oceanobacter sp. 4_MG-2023]MDP2608881.1 DUF924 family protein [Oceanobacter sp. 1_MG-2023]MDP2611877.1 DUF924 family protein [Oceanobacter sp. 2_MG-2023]